jgi:hypothetical protein
MLATKTNIRNQTKPKGNFIRLRSGSEDGEDMSANQTQTQGGKREPQVSRYKRVRKKGNRNVIARKEVYRLSIQSTKAPMHRVR